MTTRLDKLLGLLEGDSSSIRNASAKEIAEITQNHPESMNFVLLKVSSLLSHKNWETRIAASTAISVIAQTHKKFHPEIVKKEHEKEVIPSTEELLSFENFDINTERKGRLLLSSETSSEEVLATGKVKVSPDSTKKRKKQPLEEEVIQPEKKLKTTGFKVTEQPQTQDKIIMETVVDVELDTWPFEFIVNQFKNELFHVNWEKRHGAALGLKEILRFHADSAGKNIYAQSEDELKLQNEKYLEDICIRILKVFLLDRFSDFLNDQLVAPVRETCGQILGTILKFVNTDIVKSVVKNLIEMASEPKVWEISYNGILGLKYALAVRQDLANILLPMSFPQILKALKGGEDEVSSVAAESLVPVVEHILNLPIEDVNEVIKVLWSILLKLDDLSASTASVMSLLSKFYSFSIDYNSSEKLETLVPRLWLFLRHNLSTVRKATVQTLEKLIKGKNNEWIFVILPDLMRYLFQNIILEPKEDIIESTFQVWSVLLEKIPQKVATETMKNVMTFWIYLLSTPYGTKFDHNLLLLPTTIKNAIENSKKDKKNEKFTFSLRLVVEETEDFIKMRINGSKFIAMLAHKCGKEHISLIFSGIKELMNSKWASHKQISSMIIEEILKMNFMNYPKELHTIFINTLQKPTVIYDETVQYHQRLHEDCIQLLEFYQDEKLDISKYLDGIITHETASQLITEDYEICLKTTTKSEMLNKLKDKVQTSLNIYKEMLMRIDAMVLANLSSAIVYSKGFNNVAHIIIKSLLNTIQTQRSLCLQIRSSESLSILIKNSNSKDNNKAIIEVLCSLVTSSKEEKSEPIQEDKPLTDQQILQRGSSLSLSCVCKTMGAKVFTHLPSLWSLSGEVINNYKNHKNEDITNALYILKVIVPSLDTSLYSEFNNLLEKMVDLISMDTLQLPASETIAVITKYHTSESIKIVVGRIIPLLSDVSTKSRQGAAKTLEKIIEKLEVNILPYVVFFIIPLLKRMSDQDTETREISSHCFGTLIKILPLEKTLSQKTDLETEKERERNFIDQLLGVKKIEPYEIPVKIKTELRQYQKDGVSWLSFLNKFNLHGVLADDMGLGKTLQSICILAGDSENRKKMYQETKSNEYVKSPSLVVCPPTIVSHWHHEVPKFTDLVSVQYSGTPQQRKKIRDSIHDYDVVIVSYDIVRNDVALLSEIQFNYCILDEGHLIRNSKTKITKAVKQIKANHRLILTGTPIQNEVLEIWSLFDFLMPGFLGTEQEFNAKYSKPIAASKEAKPNSKEQELGTIALESLHRQVLPFLLRRVKEDVLKDLPEKIIQDYYCDLSPIQQELYEDFAKEEDSTLKEAEKELSKHVFQTLQYARKLCDHPMLVLTPEHPKYQMIQNQLAKEKKDIHDISYSPKLQALNQLLKDAVEGQHRVLIFCQLKSMLDIIEKDLFAPHLPNLTWLRLDGSVETSKRQGIVNKFNSDPTIDVLLLTTRVGGLGLNLTSADTVIFVSHDWNPQTDLQAMDRAHRIGQTKCVNVYRLITRGTIEEKIMNLQRFKLNISKTVVNRENTSFKSIDTDSLSNMYKKEEEKKDKKEDEIWDENQYNFDMESYLKQ